ncbi:flippase-like domain-containing protein [Patescibacteria group bacterium]|nr:flippase-like domain-containing protein [Patescibacteria group bacterium]
MKKLIAFVFFLILGFFLVTALFSRIEWREVWNTLRSFSLVEAFVILALTGLFLYIGAIKWRIILKGQGVDISVYDAWKAYLASFSLSFFAPMIVFGAEMFRAYTIKETHKVPFDRGLASVIIDRILEATSFVLIIFVGILVFFAFGTTFSPFVTLGVGGVMLVVVLLLLFFYVRMFKSKSIVGIFMRRRKGNNVAELEEEISNFFHFNNPYLWKVIGLTFLKAFVGLLRVWVLVFFLGKTFAILPGITILGMYYVALLIPIPAALGTHDALQAFTFGSFGLGAATGAAFAFVIRTLELIFAVIGMVLFVHLGFGLVRGFIVEHIQKVFR